MLTFYSNSVKFLEKPTSKSSREDPELVQETMSNFLKGVGSMVTSAAFTRSKEKITTEVRGSYSTHSSSLMPYCRQVVSVQ